MTSIRSLAVFNGAPLGGAGVLGGTATVHRPGPAHSRRHVLRGVGTSTRPPAGTYTWPLVGTFSWPRTGGVADEDEVAGRQDGTHPRGRGLGDAADRRLARQRAARAEPGQVQQ